MAQAPVAPTHSPEELPELPEAFDGKFPIRVREIGRAHV